MPRTVTSLNPLTVTVTGTVMVPGPVTALMSAVTRRFSSVISSISSLRPHSLTLSPPEGMAAYIPLGSLSKTASLTVTTVSLIPSSVISTAATSLPFTSHVPSGGVTT